MSASAPKPRLIKTGSRSSIQAPARPLRILGGCIALLCMANSWAVEPAEAASLADMSIEELMNESVTSVSKKEQKLSDAAAAITVLSNDDIHRSGATSVAEALRMVPGLDVAQVSSSGWAISSRGFNNLYANKLLVLVDGRAVYTPLFGGVFWDLQQSMLEDVDRIEVISGPGGTIWGSNAVNGVINVVSRSARDTLGSMIYSGGGSDHEVMAGARYGAKVGDDTYYRIFGSYELNSDHPLPKGETASDSWFGWQGGFRIDRYLPEDTQLTWQGDVTVSNLDDHASDAYNFNTIGRWSRELAERSHIEVQAYYDRNYRNDLTQTRNTVDTFDLSLQHTFGLGARNDVIWGLGYRFINNHLGETGSGNRVNIADFSQQLFNVFLQDEFKLIPDKLTLTAGTKVERNEYTGFEWLPTVRLALKPTEKQTLWAAVSRSVRSPSELEGRNAYGVSIPSFGVTFDQRYPAPASEILWAYELGYRVQPSKRVSLEISTFYNDYTDLQTLPGFPRAQGTSYGGEASMTVAVTDSWRLVAGYSLLIPHISGKWMLGDLFNGSSPEHQVSLRSSCDLTKRTSLDAQLRYVDRVQSVSGYLTGDIRLAYRPTDRLELSIVGQNLFDSQHPEQGPALSITSETPRSVYGKVTWHF